MSYVRIFPDSDRKPSQKTSYESTEFVPKLGLPILYRISVHTTSTVTTVSSLAAWPSNQSPQASPVTLMKIAIRMPGCKTAPPDLSLLYNDSYIYFDGRSFTTQACVPHTGDISSAFMLTCGSHKLNPSYTHVHSG